MKKVFVYLTYFILTAVTANACEEYKCLAHYVVYKKYQPTSGSIWHKDIIENGCSFSLTSGQWESAEQPYYVGHVYRYGWNGSYWALIVRLGSPSQFYTINESNFEGYINGPMGALPAEYAPNGCSDLMSGQEDHQTGIGDFECPSDQGFVGEL